jgi:nicotinamidase-related amidase
MVRPRAAMMVGLEYVVSQLSLVSAAYPACLAKSRTHLMRGLLCHQGYHKIGASSGGKIMRFVFVALCLLSTLRLCLALADSNNTAEGEVVLHLRNRQEAQAGSGKWDEVTVAKSFAAKETAILICDMWDKHWCQKASERCEILAKKMVPVLENARSVGVQVIHAPSECMEFYKDTAQRRRILAVPRVDPPKPLDRTEPPLPVDTTEGGCDDATPTKSYKAWTRQNATIPIGDDDVISDNGNEIYSFLHQRGIKNLIIMGVHTNMCVLGRSFGIRQMTRWGINCVLVRDLTDAMYDPRKKPFVSHEEGTELVIQHIEKYWCPTIASADLLRTPAKSP